MTKVMQKFQCKFQEGIRGNKSKAKVKQKQKAEVE